MRSSSIYLISLLLLTITSVNTYAWNLEKYDEGIKIYTQEIEGSSFKAFRGEVSIQASLKSILANHLDVESMTDWLQDCTASELVSRLSDRSFLVYQRTGAPWPVSDRDYVMKATINQDNNTQVVTMDFEASTDASKHSDECVEVTKLKGYWRFTPKEDCSVFVEYETHADPSGDLPAWLANSFVVDQPLGTLKKLRERITQGKASKDIDLSFIKEPAFNCPK